MLCKVFDIDTEKSNHDQIAPLKQINPKARLKHAHELPSQQSVL